MKSAQSSSLKHRFIVLPQILVVLYAGEEQLELLHTVLLLQMIAHSRQVILLYFVFRRLEKFRNHRLLYVR